MALVEQRAASAKLKLTHYHWLFSREERLRRLSDSL
jgi:hypothetical protein